MSKQFYLERLSSERLSSKSPLGLPARSAKYNVHSTAYTTVSHTVPISILRRLVRRIIKPLCIVIGLDYLLTSCWLFLGVPISIGSGKHAVGLPLVYAQAASPPSHPRWAWSRFSDAQATSNGLGLVQDVDDPALVELAAATELLARGNGFWASAGHHDPKEVVTVTVEAHRPRTYLGLHIEWKDKPMSFRLRSSLAEEPALPGGAVALDWGTPERGASNADTEGANYIFDEPVVADVFYLDLLK